MVDDLLSNSLITLQSFLSKNAKFDVRLRCSVLARLDSTVITISGYRWVCTADQKTQQTGPFILRNVCYVTITLSLIE